MIALGRSAVAWKSSDRTSQSKRRSTVAWKSSRRALSSLAGRRVTGWKKKSRPSQSKMMPYGRRVVDSKGRVVAWKKRRHLEEEA